MQEKYLKNTKKKSKFNSVSRCGNKPSPLDQHPLILELQGSKRASNSAMLETV